MTIAYDIATLLPSHALHVELMALGPTIRPREYLLSVELYDTHHDRVSPQDINWSYSNSLDTCFAYIPEGDGAGALRVAKPLEATVPFVRARLTVVEWKPSANAPDPAKIFGNLTYRCQIGTASTPVSADSPAIYGTIAPGKVVE